MAAERKKSILKIREEFGTLYNPPPNEESSTSPTQTKIDRKLGPLGSPRVAYAAPPPQYRAGPRTVGFNIAESADNTPGGDDEQSDYFDTIMSSPNEDMRPSTARSGDSKPGESRAAATRKGLLLFKPPPPTDHSHEIEKNRRRKSNFRQSIFGGPGAARQSMFGGGPSPAGRSNIRQSIYGAPQSKMSSFRQSIYTAMPKRQSNYRRSMYDPSNKKNARQSVYAYIDSATSSVTNTFADIVHVPNTKYHKQSTRQASWWKNWSTRKIILAATLVIGTAVLAIGLSITLIEQARNSSDQVAAWHPAIGSTWGIELNQPVTMPSLRAYVFDIDLFQNDADTVAQFHAVGRRVICHFSAGTYQDWQPDSGSFPGDTLGASYKGNDSERWIDIRRKPIQEIMLQRIRMAKDMGCDGIDPDNVDGYERGKTNFDLTVADSVKYVRFLAAKAHDLKMSIGLRNSPELIDDTLDVVQWQMNEGCIETGDCSKYQDFIEAGKPVFHIEYLNTTIAETLVPACSTPSRHAFSTLIKTKELNAWVMQCPFSLLGGY
ncbi:endo alpha-1,4 polygalactosaminidase precursor [Phlyctema vagabunda]|uniref:alpha-galactosidase n=1 Tax=Phlyctema vagabunda TaxID=108571 RepID=A0ABR4PHE9_9HELO